MSAHGDDKTAKFIGIIGHENVSHNGSKTTVYFLQVQVDNAMWVVRHRYHDFKDFYDKVRVVNAQRGEEGGKRTEREEGKGRFESRSSRRPRCFCVCLCVAHSGWHQVSCAATQEVLGLVQQGVH